MIRPAELILPELRAKLPGVSVVTDVTDVDHRQFPLLLVTVTSCRLYEKGAESFWVAAFDMNANSKTDLASAESLYYSARAALYSMWRDQKVTAKGWVHSFTENMGATRANPLFEDSWRFLGNIQLGLRPNNMTI